MNENVMAQIVLNSKRKAVQVGIVCISFAGVHVMHGKNNFLAEQSVVEHQERAIKELELIVPQKMEQLWLRRCCITNEFYVVI
jgi:hypothetical protein